jgi:hypothetical protein
LQLVSAQDKDVRYTFCSDFLSCLKDNEISTTKSVICDKGAGHLSGNVNGRNLRIWGSNNPYE